MFKKVLIALLALVGTFSIVYATQYNYEMKAAVSQTAATGITARINMAPSGLTTSSTTGFKEGDKIAIGANTNNAWLLLRKETYTDYMKTGTESCKLSINQTTAATSCTNDSISAWWVGTENTVSESHIFLGISNVVGTWTKSPSTLYGKKMDDLGITFYYIPRNEVSIYSGLSSFDKILKDYSDKELLTYRNLTSIHNLMSPNTLDSFNQSRYLAFINTSYPFSAEHLKKSFTFDLTLYHETALNSINWKKYLPNGTKAWIDAYEATKITSTGKIQKFEAYVTDPNDATGFDVKKSTNLLATDPMFSESFPVYANAYLNLNDVVFSSSITDSSSDNLITIPKDLSDSERIYKDSVSNKMIARIMDSSMTATLNDLYQTGSNTPIAKKGTTYKVSQNSTIDLSATASSNNSAVSVFLFEKATGDVKYYFQNLGSATGAQAKYTMNFAGIPIGKYQLAIVNEQIPSSESPTYSSAFTNAIEVDVVTPLSSFVYTPKISSMEYGSSSGQSNSDPIGGVTVSGGTVPYTYSFGSSGSDVISYKYFAINTSNTINGLGHPIYIDSTKVPNGKLPVGTYKFRITVTDANGASLYKDVTFTVTKGTPTITFNNKNVTQVAYSNGYKFTENVTHTDTGAVVSYSANNTIVNVTSDASGNATITLNSIGAVGDVIITATLPASTSYNGASATKTIRVYDGLKDFKFTPSKTSLTVDDTKNGNFLIGSLSINGGVANYSYSIDTDPNGNASDNANSTSFKVDTSPTSSKTMKVYTTGQLTAGTYKVTFKVKDQNNQELYLPVTITVSPAGQTGFEFYDYETNAKITNGTKEIEYGTSNAKVVASGGLGTGTVSYKIKDGQPNDIIDVDASNGTITAIHKTGSVVVEATKASDSNYNATTIEMTVKIIDGTQTITFSPPTSKKFVLDDSIPISASLTRTDGSTGTITYVSNDTSVCTIDDSDAANVKAIMKAEGECSITVSNSDSYYKEVTDTKKINLYGGITGTFIQVIDPLNQGDAKAQAGSTDTIAKVTSLAGGDGTFNLVKMTVKKAGVDVTNMFDLDHSWNITPKQSLTYGDYDFSIEIEDGNQEASTITGTLTIGLEVNNGFEITKDSTVITELTTDYVTAQNPKIMLNTQGKKGTGAVHFTLADSVKDPSETDEAITINDTGTITVNRAMTSNDLYYVQAYIDEDKTNGYAKQETKKVRVIVNESPQSITFDSTVPTSIKYDVDQTFDISATLDRTPGDIIYSSTTPSICMVEDSTKPIAKIKDKGICVIKAENNDANYVDTYKTTSITIYDGMAASFTQTINSLKQGDRALDPSTNTVIGKITGLAGNQGAVTYTLKVSNNLVDVSSDFTIDPNTGEVTPASMIKYGTYDVEITLTDSTGSSGSIKVTGTIVVGLEENTNFKITYKGSPTVGVSESYTTAIKGMDVGTTGRKGSGQVHYRLSASSHKDPKENTEALVVNDDGTITVNRATTSDDVYEVYAYVEEDLIGGYAKQETSAIPIIITDASMPNMSWLVDGVSATEIHTDYGPDKKIQLGVDQAPAGSTIEYVLVEDGTGKNNGIDVSDVVKVNKATGKVTILHASLANQIGNVLIKAKISCPGYTATELTPINVQIDKAEQTNFKFAQQVYTMPYGTGSFTPTFLNGAPHDDGTTYNNKLSCTDPYDVRVNASNSDTFVYDVQESNGASITIKARNLGNRDYKAKEATAILKVLGENENLFDVTVNPSPVITYGEAVSITPDLPESADITYEYESLDDTILVQDTTNVNTFHSKKIGTVQVKVTKKETGAVDSSVYVSIRVKPKPITVELDGTYEIKAGEAIPSFVLKDITNELVNGDSLPLPNVSISIQNTLTPGSYPITVTYPKDDSTSNYTFTQTPCDLVIIQEEPMSQWYKVYQESDATKTQSDLTKWYKEPLIMETIHSDYDQLSGNGMSNWSSTLKLDEEGIIEHSAYFKNSISNALSSPATITTKIDYTSPIVKSMTGSIVNEDGLWKLLNDLTFNTFFKPKTSVIFTVEDPKQTEETEVSGVSKISYKVYLADQETSTLKPLTTDGRITSNEIRNGKAAIVLQDPGDYYVCAKAIDVAGNEGSEVCSYLKIKGKGYDSDGDGIPDLNIDLDDDGTPDLNITRKECKIEEIGITEKCKVPYTNIDTNGDGEADTNIDLNGDGEPDLNIGKVHEWKPYIEVDIDNDGKVDFKTGAEIPWELNIDSDKDRKPDINVDVNKDGIADINIDTDNDFSKPEINIDNIGDGKAHINIDDNEDGKPDRNIVIFTRWEPNDDVKGSITYDTMYNLKANDTLIHKDTDIIVQSPPDNAFLPQYALKVEDQTEQQASVIQDELELNKMQKVEQVFHISIVDETGNVIDVHDVITVKIPISDDIHNPIFYMKKENGEVLKLNAIKKDGYFEFETEELGLVSIVGEETEPSTPDPKPIPDPKPDDPSTDEPNTDQPNTDEPIQTTPTDTNKPATSVQGTYVKGNQTTYPGDNVGGAVTGDETNMFLYVGMMFGTLGIVCFLGFKRNQHYDS